MWRLKEEHVARHGACHCEACEEATDAEAQGARLLLLRGPSAQKSIYSDLAASPRLILDALRNIHNSFFSIGQTSDEIDYIYIYIYIYMI